MHLTRQKSAPPNRTANAICPEEANVRATVLALVRALALELHPQMTHVERLGDDASLERDFGIDSLARVELALRINQTFGSTLNERVIAEAETVEDLAHALIRAQIAAPSGATANKAPVQLDLPAEAPPSPATLIDALEWHAQRQPDRTHILLIDDESSPKPITFGALRSEAAAVAVGLISAGIKPGEAVAIMLPTGREFFAAFYGALYARAIPVPLYPPARPSQLEAHLKRVAGILANCEARVLLTFDKARRIGQLLRALNTKLDQVATIAEISESQTEVSSPAARQEEIAFLQYTSGSTGQPKGVILTHANLLANLNAMQRATAITASDRFVSWLPLYHDMGLIGACLGALVFGYPLILMSPLTFLSRPARWLRAIDQHHATITAAPNFAYELCLNKVADTEIEGLDLSSLKYVFNGAEAVSAHTIERFAERFAAYGLRREALMPVYGLAECAVGLTFPPINRGPLIDCIDRESFLHEGVARRSECPEPESLRIVSCGKPIPGHAIRIVDPDGNPLPERTQGRIQFQGPSATSGYFHNPQATAHLFDGNWLNTGDLGYLADGELYVTGRAKDIIIRAGHNIHPHELEEAIGELPGVRKGGVAVFPVPEPKSGTERIVALVETRVEGSGSRDELIARINELATDLIGMPLDEVVLAPPRSVLKTSSGKIRRAACREAYQHGQLGRTSRSPWLQFARLGWAALITRFAHSTRRAMRKAWGVWALCVCGVLAPAVWLTVVLTPGITRRRRAGAAFIRLAARLCGVSLHVQRGEFDPSTRCVYVCNHASYLDGPLLMAVLPADVTFVVKQELRRSLILGLMLRRLGCIFVERRAANEAATAARQLQTRLRAGESLLVFPEGTFRRDPGVLPFHMGAFAAAVSAQVPVVPMVIRGTRTMLPEGMGLPRRMPVEVIIGQPLQPSGESWHAAIELRERARAYILEHAHEPDLEEQSAGTQIAART